jgi:serine/threonine protein kinase
MELMEGGSLAQKINGTPQPHRQAAGLVETLARAMDYVHQQQIVHRDLKPANILLTADGLPKIADFGLAKCLDDDLGLTGNKTMVLGTACYMAPEQARGKTQAVGQAADIYSLGAILYELLTGRPPFKAETRELTIHQVLEDDPVPPSQVLREVPSDLESICLKCLEKDPSDRYPSAGALAQDLQHWQAGEPLSIRPVGEWELQERWARRAGYDLLEVLTWGVRDVVYKAREVGLQRLVVLKVLTTVTWEKPAERARFQREAELVARLQHSNIVQIYNFGEHNNRAYFSMEFVGGGSLIEKYVDAPVAAQPAAHLVEKLAWAMHYAHQRDIVHGALKPSNVLLTGEGVPKIAGFGLTVLQEKEQAEAPQKVAFQRLSSYLAPELAEGRIKAVGPAVDVYALGAILYKLLTGGPPFLGETVQDTREQVCSREPVPPSLLQPDVPQVLETICLGCLQKDPARRPASAAILAEELHRFLAKKEADTDDFELIRGYELLEEVGRGGLGIVYKARHVGLDHLRALKIFRRLDSVGLGRIQAVSQALARVKHPNILQVHDCGQRDGLLYVAEELVEGITLDQKIAGKAQPPQEAARLMEVLARAMHHVHRCGIVHCNLKPRVVLLPADGLPKISSFEMAKVPGQEPQEMEPEWTVSGTPSYMAPEQTMGRPEEIGAPTDVYALGAILYQMLTGVLPFTSEKLADLFHQVRSQPPRTPSVLRPEVPCDLDAICLKCLQKEPNHRYPSAQELAEDLRRFLDGKPIGARKTGAWERVQKWFRSLWPKGVTG